MRKQKTKTASIWHRFNGRLYSFDTVEDMKRFQIQLANNKVTTVDATVESSDTSTDP